jgi:O-antigen/teichoic acid export membrane protein
VTAADTSLVSQPLEPGDVHRLADGTPLDAQPGEEARSAAATDRRRLIISGLTWGVMFQALEVVVSFGAMLVLVRILSPVDYGRAAATTGVVAMLGIFNAHLFIGHALQLPDNETPDWSQHWTFAFYIQTTLFAVCHGIAGVCWLIPAYTPIAKLLHLAAFGILFDAANHLGATMLRRDLRLRRIKIISSVGILVRIAAIVGLGVAGGRAYAIVLGNNVFAAMPFAIDLFVVRGWRPDSGWWRLPEWRRYRDALTFGAQRIAGGLMSGGRDAAETAVLPATLGFTGIGLVNRAQALYATTLGRMTAVFADTVYPFLPRESRNPQRYAVHATLYLQVTMLIAIPGAMFVGEEGRVLSRVLYGMKWIGADPLIWPGALIGLAGAVSTAASGILLAAGLLRVCVLIDTVSLASVVPSLALAWAGFGLVVYTWALASTQLVLAAVSIAAAARLLQRDWLAVAVVPPVVAAAAGGAAAEATSLLLNHQSALVQLVATAATFGIAALVVLRVCFASCVDTLLGRLPAGGRLRRLLLLHGDRTTRAAAVRPEEQHV